MHSLHLSAGRVLGQITVSVTRDGVNSQERLFVTQGSRGVAGGSNAGESGMHAISDFRTFLVAARLRWGGEEPLV